MPLDQSRVCDVSTTCAFLHSCDMKLEISFSKFAVMEDNGHAHCHTNSRPIRLCFFSKPVLDHIPRDRDDQGIELSDSSNEMLHCFQFIDTWLDGVSLSASGHYVL